jgi:translation initiation factor 2 alpha subunit (eIF-2alpha)
MKRRHSNITVRGGFRHHHFRKQNRISKQVILRKIKRYRVVIQSLNYKTIINFISKWCEIINKYAEFIFNKHGGHQSLNKQVTWPLY